jgi:hypothetical protein
MLDVTTTTGRMVRLVEHHVAQLLRLSPPDGATYLDGINGLARLLLETLDVGEFGDPTPDDILADAMEFCHSYCSDGEESGPGSALRCAACKLKPHTLDLQEATIAALTREAVAGPEETP